MTQFDRFINEFFTEGLGQMGQGGLANRGGAGTQVNSTSAPSSGGATKPTGGVQMKFSNGAAKPMNPQAITNNTVNPDELNEFTGFMDLQQKDPTTFNTNVSKLATEDPDKFGRFIQHIQQSMNPQANGQSPQISQQ